MPLHFTETPPNKYNLSTVLVTGGTGSFGSAMTACLVSIPDGPRVRVYSRDEEKQEIMAERLPPGPRLTYILGDVRDAEQLTTAADGCTHIIHAAALKRVPQGERHAAEFVKTNIDGTANVIRAALAAGVRNSLFVSSDKSVASVNHYGKTKAAAEGMFIQANAAGVSRGCKFAVVRGGNVWASRGSVVVKWRLAKAAGVPLVVYGEHDDDGNPSTRFHMTMDYWTNFVWSVAQDMNGGEIFVPKIRAWNLTDLARAFGCEVIFKEARPGDKFHESMFTADECRRVVETDTAYIVEPPPDLCNVWNYSARSGKPFREMYTSATADKLSEDELRELVNANIAL